MEKIKSQFHRGDAEVRTKSGKIREITEKTRSTSRQKRKNQTRATDRRKIYEIGTFATFASFAVNRTPMVNRAPKGFYTVSLASRLLVLSTLRAGLL